MKPFITVVIAVAGLATFNQVHAQTNTPSRSANPHQSTDGALAPEDPINRLSQELKLNNDQKTKVQEVFQETREKIQTAVQEAMTNADSRLHQILTPDQYQKLQDLEHQPPRHQQPLSEPAPNHSSQK